MYAGQAVIGFSGSVELEGEEPTAIAAEMEGLFWFMKLPQIAMQI